MTDSKLSRGNRMVETRMHAGSTSWITGKPWPFVSGIVPVFNEERYIEQTLHSLLAQDYPKERYEILVVNGRSTDRTTTIVKAIMREHSTVRLLDNPRQIVLAGLNVGIPNALGEVIIRVDGHSRMAADFLRQSVEHLLAGDAECVWGGDRDHRPFLHGQRHFLFCALGILTQSCFIEYSPDVSTT